MSTGIINDTEKGARKMKSILDKTTCAYQYEKVNQAIHGATGAIYWMIY
jgi:hypothetical protein